ncbi:hypothetical protein BX661DRAFT_63454 [Kickxella alabastrina]|uniref:uncharacterized protein n=1 Tax=Kickxella alabastrina TaxID=61397 RepID=UPI00221E37C0|nr:uncharacterized protein BX661DRAFT_63454 [Kickxella alabastrina]KAI7833613.1 hypothetical protein BX661DRAFT_63454 [Kickxella alabastrina]
MGNQVSFTVVESELQRQKTGEMLELTVDPRGKSDAILVVIFGFVYLINLIVIGLLLWNRNYPPLKSKGPVLMTLMMLISIIWFIGDLQGNGHLRIAGTVMTNCKAFGLWMRLLLGACTMCVLTALRAYGLYRVFFLNLPYYTIGLYLPFLLYYVLLLIFGIVAQVLNPTQTIQYFAPLDICEYNEAFKTSLFVFLWLTWSVMVGVLWKIRNIRSSFNEGREMLVSCIIILIILLCATTMNYMRPLYPLSLSLRVVTTVLNHCATNALWWIIMMVPMYNCIFNRQQYLSRWIQKLREDGLQNEYDIDSNVGNEFSQPFLTSYTMRNAMPHTNTTGKRDSRGFFVMQDSVFKSKEADYRLGASRSFSQSSERPLYSNSNTAYEQASRPLAAMGHREENHSMEARSDSPMFNSSNKG